MAKTRKKQAGDDAEKKNSTGFEGFQGMGGFLGGLGTLIEKLGDLAERGEELHKLGEVDGKPVHGVVGFTIKTALGDGNGIKVEPFGNVGKDQRTGKVAVHEVNEPMVDVFEEDGNVHVVAEMPGVAEGDVHLELDDDILTISADEGRKKYRKEVVLPAAFTSAQMKHTCKNGVLEVEFSS